MRINHRLEIDQGMPNRERMDGQIQTEFTADRCVQLLAGFGLPVDAQEEEDGQDTEDLRRRTPSGQYVDPASFFRFHGYVTLTTQNPKMTWAKFPGNRLRS